MNGSKGLRNWTRFSVTLVNFEECLLIQNDEPVVDKREAHFEYLPAGPGWQKHKALLQLSPQGACITIQQLGSQLPHRGLEFTFPLRSCLIKLGDISNIRRLPFSHGISVSEVCSCILAAVCGMSHGTRCGTVPLSTPLTITQRCMELEFVHIFFSKPFNEPGGAVVMIFP